MENYKLRVVIEKSELEIKRNDLHQFIKEDEGFCDLKANERANLITKRAIMDDYLNILTLIIEGFNE